MRAVFDTNVLVAAFLTEGVCSKLLIRARKGECDLFLSKDIVQEFEDILGRKFSLSRSEVSSVRALLTEAAREIIEQTVPIEPICRDPDDDKILACARKADAAYIVTGDEDLLVIKKYGKITILTPRAFEGLFPD